MHPNFERMRDHDGIYPGGWIGIPDASVVETMFSLPFDHVGIDCQHSAIDVPTAVKMLLAAPKSGGPAALIRVNSNNMAEIGKAFDGGADGVIVPMVNTADQARAAVAASRYAPGGIRSFGPFRPGMPFDTKSLEARTAVFVMVETVEAVNNVEEIAAVPGLAGIFVGPADLAITLGLPVGQNPMAPPLLEAVGKIGAACRKNNVIASGYLHKGYIEALRPFGFRMFTIGADRGYIVSGALADLKAVRG